MSLEQIALLLLIVELVLLALIFLTLGNKVWDRVWIGLGIAAGITLIVEALLVFAILGSRV